jgi:hypothetical protein
MEKALLGISKNDALWNNSTKDSKKKYQILIDDTVSNYLKKPA